MPDWDSSMPQPPFFFSPQKTIIQNKTHTDTWHKNTQIHRHQHTTHKLHTLTKASREIGVVTYGMKCPGKAFKTKFTKYFNVRKLNIKTIKLMQAIEFKE